MAAVVEGHYARKQLGCRSGIIAWSHRTRFLVALRLLGPSVRTLLDYGCGDGTFLALAAERIAEGCGADIAADQIADCRERLASLRNLHFHTVADLRAAGREGGFDAVTCMETLEHCPAPAAEAALRDLARLVRPGGRVIISVPIETGPTFLLKAVVRRLAALRGLSDYKYYESYRLGDAVRMLFAGPREVMARPEYGEPGATFHSHYGFNWRAMRERVKAHLTVERTLFSPLGFLGGWVSSQAWFVCRAPRDL